MAKDRSVVRTAQGRRFSEAARELSRDEDPARFDEILKKVARHKQPPSAQPAPKKPTAKKSGKRVG